MELLQWCFHLVPGDDGDVCMPVALVRAVRPPLDAGPHVVRVRARDAATGAIGEAVTGLTRNEEGYGF